MDSFPETYFGSLYVSGKLPTYPSLKPTFCSVFVLTGFNGVRKRKDLHHVVNRRCPLAEWWSEVASYLPN